MEVEAQCDLFRQILLAFFDENYGNSSSIKLYEDVYPHLRPGHILFSRDFLESRLPRCDIPERICGDFSGGFLCLKPVTHGTHLLPILTLNYNFGASIPKIKLRLGLYLKHENQVKAVGYRFESPEGVGRHHYYHVQMINGFTTDSFFPPTDSTKWLPDAEPTFPLDAQDSVDLMLCLLLALYGLTDLLGFIQTLPAASKKIVLDKVKKLGMGNFFDRKILFFWRLRLKDSGECTYYKTDLESKDFRDYVKDSYSNYECIEIMPGEWEKQPPTERKEKFTDGSDSSTH